MRKKGLIFNCITLMVICQGVVMFGGSAIAISDGERATIINRCETLREDLRKVLAVPNTGGSTKNDARVICGGIILPIGLGLMVVAYAAMRNVGKKKVGFGRTVGE